MAALPRGARGRASARARLRGPALGRRHSPRLRRRARRPRRAGCRSSSSRRRGRSCSSAGPAGRAASRVPHDLAPSLVRERHDDTLSPSCWSGRWLRPSARGSARSRRRQPALRGAVLSDAGRARPARGGAGEPARHHRGAPGRVSRRRETAAAGRRCRRQGLLARRARGDRRRSRAATPTSFCSASCAGSSFSARATRRSPATPSTRSATSCFATSPTTRSRVRRKAERHRRAAEWIDSLGASGRPCRAAGSPLPRRARLRPRGWGRRPTSSTVRGRRSKPPGYER